MSQLMHPISDNFGGGGGSLYFSSQANYWSAIDTSGDSKQVTATTNIAIGDFSAAAGGDGIIGPAGAVLSHNFNSVTDPGINTGHKVRIRMKWHNTTPCDTLTDINGSVAFGGAGHSFLIAHSDAGPGSHAPDVYFTQEWTMTAGEVIQFRANGGYSGISSSLPFLASITYSTLFPPNTGVQLFTFDFLEVEVPDVPPTPVSITGSGGFSLNGSTEMSIGIQITGSGGFVVDGSATLVVSLDVSGIYELIDDKRHDTLYARSGSSTTLNVEIPDPHYRTAFFGS